MTDIAKGFVLKYIRRRSDGSTWATDLRGRRIYVGDGSTWATGLGSGFACHAVTFDQDLADAGDVEGLFHLLVRQIDSVHARNSPAFDAYEVWMAAPVVRWIANLESPHVVPQFSAAYQFGVR